LEDSSDLPNDLFFQAYSPIGEHDKSDGIRHCRSYVDSGTQSQGQQRLPEHSSLPHDHGVLHCKASAGYHEYYSKMPVGLLIVAVVIFVEHWSRKNEASKDTELDCFVQAIPNAVNSEASIEQCGAEPSEPQ
jgi:hypothetical protein